MSSVASLENRFCPVVESFGNRTGIADGPFKTVSAAFHILSLIQEKGFEVPGKAIEIFKHTRTGLALVKWFGDCGLISKSTRNYRTPPKISDENPLDKTEIGKRDASLNRALDVPYRTFELVQSTFLTAKIFTEYDSTFLSLVVKIGGVFTDLVDLKKNTTKFLIDYEVKDVTVHLMKLGKLALSVASTFAEIMGVSNSITRHVMPLAGIGLAFSARVYEDVQAQSNNSVSS